MIHVYQHHRPHDYFVTREGEIYPRFNMDLHRHLHLDVQIEVSGTGPTEAQLERIGKIEAAFGFRAAFHIAPAFDD